jgi:VWFA-related protein
VSIPTRVRRRRGFGLALFLAVSGVFAAAAGPQQPQQPTPPFKAGTNFVRVDVYPTRNGVPVEDLTATDFQVAEDGAAQKIESFEHIVVPTGGSEAERVEPQSPTQADALAADPRRRVFVIFLDTGNVGIPGAHDINGPIKELLTQLLGPDDLIGLMTPDMSPDQITFARKTQAIEQGLTENWAWGRKGTLALDEQERKYDMCFDNREQKQEIIKRRRERVALDSLHDLILHMASIREGRTAVLTITEGWLLYRPSETLTHLTKDPLTGKYKEPTPGAPPPVGVGPGGTLTTKDPNRQFDTDRQECDRDLMELAMADNDKYFRDILGEANRANVSFYPIDPRGLPAMETDINEGVSLTADRAMLQTRLDSMRVLASNTDGIAFLDSNDLRGQMRRLAADFTSYYLLGYSSTNAKLDGGFRTIKVKVSRPGVEVRARRGYRAASAAELAAAKKLADTPKPAANAALDKELGMLAREGRPAEARPERPATAPVAGEPVIFRRGPTTGNVLQKWTGREFSRTERLHIEMLPGEASGWTGALLDRTGKTLPVPVTTGERTDAATGQRWLIADLTLAPLGAGDYAIELTVQRAGEPVKILKAIHVTP